MKTYRKKYYERYGQIHQDRSGPLSGKERKSWQKVYSYYLRGWFPNELNAKIVDVGCGAGNLLSVFEQKRYSKITGLEPHSFLAELAREICPNIVTSDAVSYLQQRTETFDLITGIDVIEHLTKDEALILLETAFNALRPGGRLILQTPNGESPWVGSVYYGDFTHEQCFTPHSLEKLLILSGFEKAEYRSCGPVPHDIQGMIRYGIWQSITQVCRILNRIEGAVSSGIYTRVFIISAIKPLD